MRNKVCPSQLVEQYDEFSFFLDSHYHFTFMWDQRWNSEPPLTASDFLALEFKSPTKGMKRTCQFVAQQIKLMQENNVTVAAQNRFWASFLKTLKLNVFSTEIYADLSLLLSSCYLNPKNISDKLKVI